MSEPLPKPKASTQDHLDLEDVIDDLVILKTGWVALVLNTTAVNFDLLSEAEQDATIYAYGAFLNSLTFPIEILIRSKKADISAYFQALAEAEKVQPNPDLKRQIQKYEDFIQATVQQRTVLDKKFYIVITYSAVDTSLGLMGKKTSNNRNKRQILEAAKASLGPRRDHVAKQLARLGLNVRQLTSQELVELFYDIYNPAPTGTQRVILDSSSYTAPLVEPAIENPAPAPARFDTKPVEAGKPPAGSFPHAEVSVGQQDAVVEVGLRPAPPRGEFGGLDNQKIGEAQGQGLVDSMNLQPSGQPPAQTDALQELQKAVAEATKLSGGIQPSGGLDLREENKDQDTRPDDNSGGFKI